MSMTATDAGETQPTGEIVARGGTYYRVTRYLFAAGMLVMGAWFGYDGYVTYPRSNELHLLHAREPAKYPKDYPTYDAKSIGIQKVLAVVLPAGALAMLGWTLHHSRGAYRLSGDVLRVPGHPDVPLSGITQIDKSRWDRKGIAKLDYALASGEKGTLTLDDFVYDRPPTDRILETIEARLGVGAGVGPADESTSR
jgi:hypothetical protein